MTRRGLTVRDPLRDPSLRLRRGRLEGRPWKSLPGPLGQGGQSSRTPRSLRLPLAGPVGGPGPEVSDPHWGHDHSHPVPTHRPPCTTHPWEGVSPVRADYDLNETSTRVRLARGRRGSTAGRRPVARPASRVEDPGARDPPNSSLRLGV